MAKDCGVLFPGVPCRQMKPEQLRAFISDIQNFGFTPQRKMRLLQAVGRLLSTLAFDYSVRYGGKIEPVEFCGAAWLAIASTVEHYDSGDPDGGSFTTLLIFWARHEFDKLIYRNINNKRYSGDVSNLQFVSIDKPVTAAPDSPRIIDTLGNSETEQELERLESRHRLKMIFKNARLSERYKKVIDKSFGLDDGVPIDNDAIGQNMGLGRERVRQIRKSALRRLQAAARLTTKRA